MEDYQTDEADCPECGHYESRYRDCDQLNCEDGVADENFDDAINSPIEGVDVYTCPECKGRGIKEWCPNCGYEYTGNEK